jgi:hypothetical protein
MPFPVLAQVLSSLGQAYAAAVAPLDPVQDFIYAGPPGQAAELSGQELLQGLALALCALLKGGVDIVGKVSNEQIRHAYIMQASPVAEQVTAASRHNPGGARRANAPSCRCWIARRADDLRWVPHHGLGFSVLQHPGRSASVGSFGAYVFDGSTWHTFEPDADEKPHNAPPWLSVEIHDSDFAVVRYEPAGPGSGTAYIGYTPRTYFEDESASAPTDVLRETEALAKWLARQQLPGREAALRELIVPFLADDNPEQLEDDTDLEDDAADLDDSDLIVEVKVARFLQAVGLPIPDGLPSA